MQEKNRGPLAVLTGGGDCPGLNAVIRAVVKTAIHHGFQIYGISNGFHGLICNDMDNPFHYAAGEDDKGNVIYEDKRDVVVRNLKDHGIGCLIVIGGDGSLKIAYDLHRFCGVDVVGVRPRKPWTVSIPRRNPITG